MKTTPEHERSSGVDWKQWRRWGAYLADRSWGTVRESTPDKKDAWGDFTFEQSRSRVYRWTEDGIGGFSDDQQRLCMSVAFWNGHDPILKERFFGLGNEQGNHGEDAKDYWFLLDATPSQSYMKLLYRYPQAEFPYDRLVEQNAARKQDQPAFNLIDALPNTFAEKRYFDILIEYAKAAPDDVLCRISVTNRASEAAPLHILPHLFFRNTWQTDGKRPQLRADGEKAVRIEHPDFDGWRWAVESSDALLFTENETNTELLYDQPNATPYTKDGIDYAVVRGQTERVNPDRVGTKCAAHIVRELAPGETFVVRTRLSASKRSAPFADFDAAFDQRQREADAFYTSIQPRGLNKEQRMIQRRAFASLCWNNVYYPFNVKTWLKENPPEGKPGEQRQTFEQWKHFASRDIISVPDPWEYPWPAAWDIDFQLATICLIDPLYAKEHALLLLDGRYMREDGAIPAFEGDFSTPHPPIHAWAVWHIYQHGGCDKAFLREAFERLQHHFDWWMKEHQPAVYLFDGGFVGKDNISVLDRSNDIPEGGQIHQADSTGWMAHFTLHLLKMAVELERDKDAEKYLRHFGRIRKALESLWDDKSDFLFDIVRLKDGTMIPLQVRNFAGMIALLAAAPFESHRFEKLPKARGHLEKLSDETGEMKAGADGRFLLAALSERRIAQLLNVLFDTEEFYSPFGLRSLSKIHERKPVALTLEGKEHKLQYEAGSSPDRTFGGNSNWRGPIWAPLNQVMIEALHVYSQHFQSPLIKRGSRRIKLETAANQLIERLIALFERDEKGVRPCQGHDDYIQTSGDWKDYFWFYEYFHSEKGYGLGAMHQNGWTAVIATLIQNGGQPPHEKNGQPPQKP
jgi:hypothetical protein